VRNVGDVAETWVSLGRRPSVSDHVKCAIRDVGDKVHIRRRSVTLKVGRRCGVPSRARRVCVLDKDILTTLLLCMGHDRDVLVNAVDDFLGDSTLPSLIHGQDNTRGLLANKLSMGVTMSSLHTFWSVRLALNLVVPLGAGHLLRYHVFGGFPRGHTLVFLHLRNRCFLLRTDPWLWGLSDGVVRLQGHLLTGFPESGKCGLETGR